MITATFTKLLDIKIVANKYFGLSSNFFIARWDFVLDEFKISFSFGFNEKNATSEPDISAENKSKIKSIPKEVIAPIETDLKNPANKINDKMGWGSSNF